MILRWAANSRLNLERARRTAANSAGAAELSRFKQRIDGLKNGETQFVNTPPARAAAAILNRSIGGIAGKAISYGLRNRSELVYSQIAPFIKEGSTVLDIGCGDGKVGELVSLRKNANVYMIDTVDYHQAKLSQMLNFGLYDGADTKFPSDVFDHALLLTVLHHSDDPIAVMKEALRVADSVIVIESTYFNRAHRQLNKLFDWFYNRCLNNPDINVPFNFLPPTAWVGLFQELGGRVTHMEHLGLDQPLVPEWHVLYVVERVK